MPRTLRVEYPGAIDYLMDRGDRREAILADDVDRQDFRKSGHPQKPEAVASPLDTGPSETCQRHFRCI